MDSYSKKVTGIIGFDIPTLVISALDQAISKNKRMLFYVNKDGDISEATNTSIWFFLKKDKELLKEYDSEKVFNIETFKKYLIKMNNKYSTF